MRLKDIYDAMEIIRLCRREVLAEVGPMTNEYGTLLHAEYHLAKQAAELRRMEWLS